MQRVRRAPDLEALRYRLLAGAAAVALLSTAGAVQAQETPATEPRVAQNADGLTPATKDY